MAILHRSVASRLSPSLVPFAAFLSPGSLFSAEQGLYGAGRRRATGGAGIPAFFTRTGYGTLIAEGKETRQFDGEWYVMELALTADIALIKGAKADKAGNLMFNKTARNFNPLCAKAGRVCVAEVEEIVEVGELAPDDIHLPGIYVQRLVLNPNPEKRIEVRTVMEKN